MKKDIIEELISAKKELFDSLDRLEKISTEVDEFLNEFVEAHYCTDEKDKSS